MPLPVLSAPKYDVKIPSTGKTVHYRPYLVQEEKLLLLAQESKDTKEVLQAMKDIVSACTFEKIDVDSLTLFDIEYLFLKLRIKSVGETSKIGIKCEKCEKPTDITIALDKIEVSQLPTSKAIKLTDRIGVNMRYPTIGKLRPDVESNSKIETAIDILIDCIDSIHDSNGIYPSSDQSTEEMRKFVNSMNYEQFVKLQEFVSAMPKLEHDIKFKCSHCGTDNAIKIEGLESFFA